MINYIPVNAKDNVVGKFAEKFSINLKKKQIYSKLLKIKILNLKIKKKLLMKECCLKIKNYHQKKSLKYGHLYTKKKKNFRIANDNEDTKILFYLFFSDYFNMILTNIVLFFKNKLYLKKIFKHKSENLEKEKPINKLKNCVNV